MIEAGRSKSKYYLQLFGRPSISFDQPKELQFSTRRALQLLAILAIHPDQEFSRLELGRILWPDDFDDANRIKFRQELLRLTSTLGPAGEIIARDKSHVRFCSDHCHSDVAELKLLRAELGKESLDQGSIHDRIIAITSGPFLEGRSDPWIDTQRERFAAVRSASLTALNRTFDQSSLTDFQILSNPHFPAFGSERIQQRGDAPPAGSKAKLSIPELVGPVFCGRKSEIEELKKLLLDSPSTPCRLVTILGPGGIGKTRIAQELCNLAREWFANRTWFVDLADHTNSDFIFAEVLSKLGLKIDSSSDIVEAIRFGLEGDGDHGCLIVLDNLEQFQDCGAKAIYKLLQAIPNLTIVATSRKPVLICHEQQYHLYPLDTEEENSSAERMFVELARKIDHDFQSSAGNMQIVKEIVSLLEGVPLSIALAASRIDAINLAALKDSLQTKVVSLATHYRDVSDRHQTLRACIDWSYELLPLEFRKPFVRLAVFAGGWYEEGACRVIGCSDCSGLMEELETSSLIDSIVVSGAKHYKMLECIREYAYEKLESEEIDQLRLAHFEALNDFCKELSIQVCGKAQQDWLSRAEVEADNIREALLWSVDFQPSRSVEFLANQISFWWGAGRYNEGIKLLEHVERKCGSGHDLGWGRLCWSIGAIFAAKSEFEKALDFLQTGIDIFRRENHATGMSSCLFNLAELYLLTDDYEAAARTCLENLEWVDPTNVRDVTYPKSTLAECWIQTGRVREARMIIDDLLVKADLHGDPICRTLPYYAEALLGIETCDLIMASDALDEAEAILTIIETPRIRAYFRYTRGLLHQKAGKRADAIESFESAKAIFEKIGDEANCAKTESSLAECIYQDSPYEAIEMISKAFVAFGRLKLLAGQLRCCLRLICLRAPEMNTLRALQLLDTLQYLGRESGFLFNPSEQRAISAIRLSCLENLPMWETESQGVRIQPMNLRDLFIQAQSNLKLPAQSLLL